MRLSDQFDPPVHKVVASGRVLLTGFALLAVEIDPTHSAVYAGMFRFVLVLYMGFSLCLLMMPITFWWRFDSRFSTIEHAIDTLFVTLILFMTNEFSSLFFVFLTFILLSATLRWGWRAVVVTAGALLLLAGLGAAAQGPLGPAELNLAVIRAGYLLVITVCFAFVSAFLENSHLRLSRLAARPELPARAGDPVLDPLLQHVASVAAVPRVAVAWKAREEPTAHSVVWDRGVSTGTTRSSSTLIAGPYPGLGGEPYLTGDLRKGGVLAASGWKRPAGRTAAAFAAELAVTSMVTAPFQGRLCEGRVYLLDGQVWSEDNLALSSLTAAQIGLEIDRHLLLKELAATAAAGERARLGRDIHDSVLQTLAAAALQLKLMEKQESMAAMAERAALVREMLADEQRRVRAFVESARRPASVAESLSLGEEIRLVARDATSKWGLKTTASTRPADAVVRPEIGKQVKLLVSEALANSARHGKAEHVSIGCTVGTTTLSIRIEDDGGGFPDLSGSYSHAELARQRLGPGSIVARTSELGGTVDLKTSTAGTILGIELPLQ